MPRSFDHALLWGTALLAAVLSCLLWDITVTNDNQVLLYNSIRTLQDGGLYVKWIELNPPLICLIYCLPASLILWLHVAPNHALYLCNWLLCAWSIAATGRRMRRSSLPVSLCKRVMAASLFGLLVVSLNYGVFADREHLLFILSLPWIIQMLFGLPPGWGTIIPAAVGFCLKPYDMLIPLALILFGGDRALPLRRRLLCASAFGIAGVACAYGLLVWLCFPAYIQRIMPLAFAAYPFVYNPFATKLINIGAFGMLAIAPAFYRPPTACYHPRPWIALVASSALCYLLNGGWRYTNYLLLLPASLLLVCFLPATATRHEAGFRRLQLLVVAGLTLMSAKSVWTDWELTHQPGFPGYAPRYSSQSLIEALAPYTAGPYILLSSDVWSSGMTDLRRPLRHVYGYDYLLLLPWLVNHPHAEQSERIRRMLTDPLIQALHDYPQAVLIVDDSPHKLKMPESTDIVRFLKQYPDVATGLAPYAISEKVNRCTPQSQLACAFSIWRPAR